MRTLWTEQDTAALKAFIAEHRPFSLLDWEPIAQQLKRSVQACRLKAQKEGWHGVLARRQYQGVKDANEPLLPLPTPEERAAIAAGVEAVESRLHVKKLHVHVPPAVTPASSNGMLTAVLYGDTHYPFQDDSALRIVSQVIRDAKPDVVVHMGDLMDTYHLSRFDKNPKRVHGLQGEIDLARAHLASFRLLAPKARFVYLEGNHEDRLRRALWNMPPQAEALMKLDAVTNNLTWPKLLGLDELDIEFYSYSSQSKVPILPKMVLKHGSVVRKLSSYTARAELDKYNKSGASGHTHRLGVFFHRDSNGNHFWVETGATCLLDPEYAVDVDWQQGCIVLTFEPVTGAFQVEVVYIHNGSAVFRDRFYDVKAEDV